MPPANVLPVMFGRSKYLFSYIFFLFFKIFSTASESENDCTLWFNLLTDQTTIIKLKTVSESNRNLTWIEQKNSFKMRMHNNRSSSLNIPVTAAAAAAFLTTSMMMMMMMMMLLVLMLSSSSSSSSSSIFVSGAVVEYNMALVQRLGQKPIVGGIDSGLSPDW